MGRCTITKVEFKVSGSAISSMTNANNSSVVTSVTLNNTDSSTDMSRCSLYLEWLDSKGSIIGGGYILGTGNSKGSNGASVSVKHNTNGAVISTEAKNIASVCGLSNSAKATQARIKLYGWYKAETTNLYWSTTYTWNYAYTGEWHNLKINSINIYRKGASSTIYYKFNISRDTQPSGVTWQTDYWKITKDGSTVKSGSYKASQTEAELTSIQSAATFVFTVYNSTGESVSKEIYVGLPQTTLHLAPSANGGLGIGQYADAGSNNAYGRLDVAYPSYFNSVVRFSGNVYGSPVCFKSGDYIEWTGDLNVAFGYITSTRSSLHCIIPVNKSLSNITSFTVSSITVTSVGTQALTWSANWGSSTPIPTSVDKCNGDSALHLTWAFGSDKGSSNITNNETCQFRGIKFKIKCN